MIRLAKIVIALGLLWSLYWYVSGYMLRDSIGDWFAARAERGWQAEFTEISTSGYPLRHATMLEDPVLADPLNGTVWQADWLLLDSPAIWPGELTLRFPAAPQRLSYFDQTATLAAEDMSADLHLRPGTALEVRRMALTAGRWAVRDDTGGTVGADTLVLQMDQQEVPELYHIVFDADRFSPGERFRNTVDGSGALPARFDALTLRMRVTFDRPWDRSALEERRPQPVAIELDLAEAGWGPMRLKAAGSITVDSAGIPTGSVSLKAEEWRDMLIAAQTAGALPPALASTLESALSMLARIGGNRDDLDVKLALRDGMVALGPLPIAPAPRLRLH